MPSQAIVLMHSNIGSGYDDKPWGLGQGKDFFYYEVELLVFISDCHFWLGVPRKKYLLHLENEKPTREVIIQNPEMYWPTSNVNCNRVFILISRVLAPPSQYWYLF